MSNHSSQRRINLHHKQVVEGRERDEVRHTARLNAFLSLREAFRVEGLAVSYICFCFFVSISFISVVYLGWLT